MKGLGNSAGLPPEILEAILAALAECEDSLAVYRNILRQQPAAERHNVDVPPGIGRRISGALIPPSLTGDVAEMTASPEEAAREKLRQDSLYVSGIIRDLRREISERGTIDVLVKEIERITLREQRERLLTEESDRMRATATELRKALAEKKTSNEKEENRLTRKLTLVREERERLKLIKDVEMRYVRAWEKARREQNVLRYELEMNELEKTLNDCYVHEKNENRVNAELTRYLAQRIAVIENRIEQWRRRYDRERKMYETEIGKVRKEMEDARKYLEALTTEYRDNQEFIDAFLAEQEELRRQKEHEDHVRRSVIRVQAWWRGVMVRRKLGPYRPEEKKKKRPAKTKK